MIRMIIRFVTVAVAAALSFAHAASTASSKGDGTLLSRFLVDTSTAIGNAFQASAELGLVVTVLVAVVTFFACLILLIPHIIERCKSSSERKSDNQRKREHDGKSFQHRNSEEFAARHEETLQREEHRKSEEKSKRDTNIPGLG